jgi:hypothetical protein
MRAPVFAYASLIVLLAANRVLAQDPPPRIGPFVVDLHATVPRFPQDVQLAESRDMALAELPGNGLGVLVGVHVYPLRWRAVTFGLGGEFATGRARQTPAVAQTTLRPATERLTRAISLPLSEQTHDVLAVATFDFGQAPTGERRDRIEPAPRRTNIVPVAIPGRLADGRSSRMARERPLTPHEAEEIAKWPTIRARGDTP